MKYRLDKATTGGDSSAGAGWKYSYVGGGTSTTFSTATETTAIFTINDSANIYEVGVELNASGSDTPEIDSIVTYIERENQDYD